MSVRVWNKGSARTAGPSVARASVNNEVIRIVRCSKCKGLRLNLNGPHSAHHERGRIVDCVGAEVRS